MVMHTVGFQAVLHARESAWTALEPLKDFIRYHTSIIHTSTYTLPLYTHSS